MHSMSALFPSSINRAACAACVCATFLLMFWSCALQFTSDPTDETPMDISFFADRAAQREVYDMQSVDTQSSNTQDARREVYDMQSVDTQGFDTQDVDTQSSDALSHHLMRILRSYHHAMRISVSDLQSRHALEQSIQIAAFEQFGSQKTGRFYNVSVSAAPSAIVQAIRLRSGSFRRYGLTINEFIIPRGCQVDPTPERVLIVYTQLANTTLFKDLPDGYVLASPVLSVLVYNAMNLTSSQPPQQIAVSTTAAPITILFAASSSMRCASFDENSINVSYTDLVNSSCQVTHAGTFALVSNVSVPTSSPLTAPIAVSPRLPSSHSNTWKIVVGSVVGGFALLVLVSLLALGIANRRKKAKFAKMEYQAEHGETLQTTTIRNSRVPAAGSTRTQSMIEREYSV